MSSGKCCGLLFADIDSYFSRSIFLITIMFDGLNTVGWNIQFFLEEDTLLYNQFLNVTVLILDNIAHFRLTNILLAQVSLGCSTFIPALTAFLSGFCFLLIHHLSEHLLISYPGTK